MSNQPNDDRNEYSSLLDVLSQSGLIICSKKELEDLKAEIAVMKIRVEKAINEGRDSSGDLARENASLKSKILILKRALSFYANSAIWEHGVTFDTLKELPGGRLAKEALQEAE